MKKILLLGGSAQQIVAIEAAKKLGYYTVLCDYLTDNPGQYHADRFYLVSTIDKEAVLQVAKDEKIDGVLAYASDPAAPTAAYVAEQLGLPTNPYESVEILSNKDRFRKFLAENDFCTPKAMGFSSLEEIRAAQNVFRLPVLIKPVDSSGSKGIKRINDWSELDDAYAYAMEYSRGKRVVIEEYLEKFGYQIAGDGLVVNGKLIFRYFGNDHFNPKCTNPYVPVSASFPYNMPKEVHDKIHSTIQRLVSLLHMQTSCYNFDIRIDSDYNVYLMEVAPRDGGNFIPQVIRYATGIDLIDYAVRGAMNEPIELPDYQPAGFWSYFAVHSYAAGILKEIRIAPEVLEQHIVENHILVKPGDRVSAFTGANTTLGILIMKFDSMEQMLHMMDHPDEWIQVVLEETTGKAE